MRKLERALEGVPPLPDPLALCELDPDLGSINAQIDWQGMEAASRSLELGQFEPTKIVVYHRKSRKRLKSARPADEND